MSRAKGKRRKPVEAPVARPLHRAAAFSIAALSVVAFIVLALGNIRATSPVYDETVHLVAGYRYLTAHDYRLNAEHPPLLKLLAAIPLRSMTIWPDDGRVTAGGSMTLGLLNEAWAMAVANPTAEWTFAHRLLYSVRDATLARLGVDADKVPSTVALRQSDFLNDVTAMFTRARTAMLLTGILLAVAIFLWSLEVWGPWAAALSTILFCFDPNFIANSGLVTTDTGVSLLMFVSLWFFWRVCRSFSWPDVASFAVCFGLSQTAKFSALLLAPIVVVIALVHGRRQLPRMALAIGIAFLTAYIVVWAAYGFRFSAAADPPRAAAEEASARATLVQRWLDAPPSDGHPPIRRLVEDAAMRRALLEAYPNGAPSSEVRRARTSTPAGFFGRSLIFAAGARLLPEAYLEGLANLQGSTVSRNSFLRGEYSMTGFGDYFFWTFLYKTPLPAIAAILAAFVVTLRRRPAGLLPFLLWPVAIYLAASVRSNLDIGHRHILPIYPFLYVLCGSLAPAWEAFAPRRRAALAMAAVALIVTASLFVFAGAPAPLWSRHLSYLNELAGGPERGFVRLADSNIDWGQDLPRLAAWLREHHAGDPINLVYIGTADPRYYCIRHNNLALGYFAEPQLRKEDVPEADYFAISATAYIGAPFDLDSRDYWRSYLANRSATLAGKAGYSIFIYRLGKGRLPPL